MTRRQLKELCDKITLEEKIGMVHGDEFFATKGVERLGIPPFRFSDGPMGVRLDYREDEWIPIGMTYDESSYLPCNTAIAATWNRELASECGRILGKEARGRGKDMILAPGVNLLRSPLCGRNFEYMGEDPCLAAEMVVPLIQGVQEYDVSACVKHYALNNQENERMSVNAQVSERALRELYLPAFEAAVTKAGSLGIMGAYNRFRGTHCCHHGYLLDEILRKEWGFEGICVSDWGGIHDTVEAGNVSMDIDMSVTDDFDDYFFGKPLQEAVENGDVSMEKLDEKVMHILYVMNELHMLDGKRNPGGYNDYRDKEKLLKAAEEAVTVLRNDKGILPLAIDRERNEGKTVLVIGDNANRKHSVGGGSSEIKGLYEMTPLLGITMAAGGNVKVLYERGYEADTNGNIWAPSGNGENGQADSLNSDQEQPAQDHKPDELNMEMAERALKATETADYVIFVGGLNHDYDTEGRDMLDMRLPYGQDELIGRLLKIRPDAVIVLQCGTPVELGAWADEAATIVHVSYSGMEGGHGLANVLFGLAEASGRLTFTFPVKLSDTPAERFASERESEPIKGQTDYLEDIFVGYRYYETFGVKPRFPFGHGLSYTDITLDAMDVKQDQGSDQCRVRVMLTNRGSRRGAQVVQIYAGKEQSTVKRPAKELKAFEKVWLAPGESCTLTFLLTREQFAYYNETEKKMVTEPGEYQIMAGISVENIMLTGSVTF